MPEQDVSELAAAFDDFAETTQRLLENIEQKLDDLDSALEDVKATLRLLEDNMGQVEELPGILDDLVKAEERRERLNMLAGVRNNRPAF